VLLFVDDDDDDDSRLAASLAVVCCYKSRYCLFCFWPPLPELCAALVALLLHAFLLKQPDVFPP
jgi:hypothetical protein